MTTIRSKKLEHKHLVQHETKQHVLIKFSFVLSIFILYFIFIATKYGVEQGFFVSMLTWSFFVMCTPVADAGFLIDFPLRLVLRIKMVIAEIFVWGLAVGLNIYAVLVRPEIYEKTKILVLFKNILYQPIPFWSIIFISLIGTFVSITFGDELLDKASHAERTIYKKQRGKHRILIMFFLFCIAFVLYDLLLNKLGIDLPL